MYGGESRCLFVQFVQIHIAALYRGSPVQSSVQGTSGVQRISRRRVKCFFLPFTHQPALAQLSLNIVYQIIILRLTLIRTIDLLRSIWNKLCRTHNACPYLIPRPVTVMRDFRTFVPTILLVPDPGHKPPSTLSTFFPIHSLSPLFVPKIMPVQSL